MKRCNASVLLAGILMSAATTAGQSAPQVNLDQVPDPRPAHLYMPTCPVIYVDRDWGGATDGTADKPFRSVNQALRQVMEREYARHFYPHPWFFEKYVGSQDEYLKAPPGHYQIYVAEGRYGVSDEVFGNERYGQLRPGRIFFFGGFKGYDPKKKAFDWTSRAAGKAAGSGGSAMPEVGGGLDDLGGLDEAAGDLGIGGGLGGDGTVFDFGGNRTAFKSAGGTQIVMDWIKEDNGATIPGKAGAQVYNSTKNAAAGAFYPVLHVDPAAGAKGNGTAKAPYRTLTRALAEVAKWKTTAGKRNQRPNWSGYARIKLARGTYGPDTEDYGKDGLLVSGRCVEFWGGYAGGGNWSEDSREAGTTILDGQGKGRLLRTKKDSGAGFACTGIVFRNGKADGPGGAVWVAGGAGSQLLIHDSTFENCRADGPGGAVHAVLGEPRSSMSGARFVGNTSGDDGGGLSVMRDSGGRASMQVRHCLFENNKSGDNGGGMSTSGVRLSLTDTVFRGNGSTTADAWGGGVRVHGEQVYLVRCKLYGNTAAHGAALGATGISSAKSWVSLYYANQGGYAVELDGFDPERSDASKINLGDHGVKGHHSAINFTYNTIADNGGGGWRFRTGAHCKWVAPEFRWNIVHGNGGVGFDYEAAGSIDETFMDFNTVGANQGGNFANQGGPGMGWIEDDPMFRDRTNADLAKRDYNLKPGSWSIHNAISYEPFGVPHQDMNGNWQCDDRGAYRFQRRPGDPPPLEDLSVPDAVFPSGYDATRGWELNRNKRLHYRAFPVGRWRVFNYYVDVNWKGEQKGTKDAPFRSIGQAMWAFDRQCGRQGYGHTNCELEARFFIADGTYDRSVEEFGAFGLTNAKGIRSYIGSFQGWDPDSGTGEGATFDWSYETRGKRTTVIDPEGKSRAFNLISDYGTYIRYDGFTFRNGRTPRSGGAVKGSYGDCTISTFRDCLFENNFAGETGGAITAGGGKSGCAMPYYIEECDFVGNEAGIAGGAVACGKGGWYSSVHDAFRIERSTFKDNRAGKYAGAVAIGASEGGYLIEDCVFTNNQAPSGGALGSNKDAGKGGHSPEYIIRRCVFEGNRGKRGAVLFPSYGYEGRVLTYQGDNQGKPAKWVILESRFRNNQGDFAVAYAPWVEAVSCTFENNQSGGIQANHLRSRECVFTDNKGTALAHWPLKGWPAASAKKAGISWSVFRGNAEDLAGGLAMGVGCGKNVEGMRPAGSDRATVVNLFVAAGGDGDGSQGNPFGSLSAAVAEINRREAKSPVANSYKVHLRAGVYDSTVEDFGKDGITILQGAVTLLGGYADDWETREPKTTILNAGGRSRILTTQSEGRIELTLDGLTLRNGSADTGGAILFAPKYAPEPRTLVVKDCAIENSTASGPLGGGLYVTRVADGCRLENVTVSGNTASEMGGGVFSRAPLEVKGCLFEKNKADAKGGGIGFECNKPFAIAIADSTFRYNQAKKGAGLGIHVGNRPVFGSHIGLDVTGSRFYGNQGSAIYADHGYAWRIEDCLIYANKGSGIVNAHTARFWPRLPDYKGEGRPDAEWLYAIADDMQNPDLVDPIAGLTVRRCTIVDNGGDAVYLVDGYNHSFSQENMGLEVTECIITGNRGKPIDYRGSLEHVQGPPFPVVEHNAYWNNGGPAWQQYGLGQSCLLDPEFVDATNEDLARRDYALKADSPLQQGLAQVAGQRDWSAFKQAQCVRAKAAPTIDGKLQDAIWTEAVELELAHTPEREGHFAPKQPFPKTRGWLAYDAQNLYIAVRCTEPNMKGVRVVNDVRPDSPMHGSHDLLREAGLGFGGVPMDDLRYSPRKRQDCIELTLVPGLGGEPGAPAMSWHVVNSEGDVYDARSMTGNWTQPEEWDAPCTVKTHMGAEEWTVEMAIPWKSLGIEPPKQGDRLGANLCRYRPASKGWRDWVRTHPDLDYLDRTDGKSIRNVGVLVFE